MRWRRRVSADIDQAIGNVGWSKPPALAASPRPAPGQPKCTMTVDFYDDGSSVILDHRNHRKYRIAAAEPDIDLSDAALEEFLRDQH